VFRILLSSGDSEIAKIVIDESNAGGEEARKFLEEVRCTFPQVCAYNVHLSVDLTITEPSASSTIARQFTQQPVIFCKTRESTISTELGL
jgi:hypothetical protein